MLLAAEPTGGGCKTSFGDLEVRRWVCEHSIVARELCRVACCSELCHRFADVCSFPSGFPRHRSAAMRMAALTLPVSRLHLRTCGNC